jgi:hypothetical protein
MTKQRNENSAHLTYYQESSRTSPVVIHMMIIGGLYSR